MRTPHLLRTAAASACLLALAVTAAPAQAAQAAAPAGTADADRLQITVAQDGTGDHTTVQAAVDAAPTHSSEPVDIVIERGVYREVVRVDRDKTHLSFIGATGHAKDVVLTYDNASGTPKPGGGTYGTTGSATVTLAGADFTARDVTFENSFDEAAHPGITNRQAVAVKTTADRIVFDDVRFLGNQDTLYLDSPNATEPARVYVRDSYVEGDVDFIFGRATAVIDGATIRALERDSTPNGYVLAPSTSAEFSRGFLVTDSRFISTAKRGTYSLGRPWRPSSNPSAEPRVVVRDSYLAKHIAADPWTEMSGRDWTGANAAEYRNVGPGAKGAAADRPQLTDAQARDHEIADYLAGDDGWDPTDPTR